MGVEVFIMIFHYDSNWSSLGLFLALFVRTICQNNNKGFKGKRKVIEVLIFHGSGSICPIKEISDVFINVFRDY